LKFAFSISDTLPASVFLPARLAFSGCPVDQIQCSRFDLSFLIAPILSRFNFRSRFVKQPLSPDAAHISVRESIFRNSRAALPFHSDSIFHFLSRPRAHAARLCLSEIHARRRLQLRHSLAAGMVLFRHRVRGRPKALPFRPRNHFSQQSMHFFKEAFT
jgi:hypothetical protein